VIIYRILHKN